MADFFLKVFLNELSGERPWRWWGIGQGHGEKRWGDGQCGNGDPQECGEMRTPGSKEPLTQGREVLINMIQCPVSPEKGWRLWSVVIGQDSHPGSRTSTDVSCPGMVATGLSLGTGESDEFKECGERVSQLRRRWLGTVFNGHKLSKGCYLRHEGSEMSWAALWGRLPEREPASDRDTQFNGLKASGLTCLFMSSPFH